MVHINEHSYPQLLGGFGQRKIEKRLENNEKYLFLWLPPWHSMVWHWLHSKVMVPIQKSSPKATCVSKRLVRNMPTEMKKIKKSLI